MLPTCSDEIAVDRQEPPVGSIRLAGRYGSRMRQKYEVRFAKGDPETPPTMDEQIALARVAARKLGIPNSESKPLYRVGRNSHTGEVWAYVEWTWEGLR
jgi:hypothetical protein